MEFALALPLLLLFFAGIVDFGFRLYQLHALEDGIRDAVRTAAVGDVGTDVGCSLTGPGTPTEDTMKVVCLVKDRIMLNGSDLRIKIFVDSGGAVEGEPLVVCAQYPTSSMTGLLPTMTGLAIEAQSIMRLEVDLDVQSYAETDYGGGWATQCGP